MPSFTINESDVLINDLANPIIEAKYEKKTFEFVFEQQKKKNVFRGVKEVKKAIRKNHKGLVILSADTHPFDVISAFPVTCEEKNLKYYYVRSKH